MILVDSGIKKRASEIIVENYDETNVNAVSYDVTIQSIVTEEDETNSYILEPNETIFIKTKEKIHMPNDLMGRIGEKNSKMRVGLSVSGPHYFPGHTTYMFLRVRNISPNKIKIEEGDKIAQIFFEQLETVPQKPYNLQENASFNDEDKYRGIAGYKDEYEKKIEKYENSKKELEDKETSIYANIMTIMGVFVSIFSLIMVNFSKLNSGNTDIKFLVLMNLSLAIVVVLFIGMILLFLNKARNKRFLAAYIGVMIILIGFLVAFSCLWN